MDSCQVAGRAIPAVHFLIVLAVGSVAVGRVAVGSTVVGLVVGIGSVGAVVVRVIDTGGVLVGGWVGLPVLCLAKAVLHFDL